MAETGFIGWIPEIRNLIISISPGHLMGGAKDNQKYRKIYYLLGKYFYTGEILLSEKLQKGNRIFYQFTIFDLKLLWLTKTQLPASVEKILSAQAGAMVL
jgi:hypothetical protein